MQYPIHLSAVVRNVQPVLPNRANLAANPAVCGVWLANRGGERWGQQLLPRAINTSLDDGAWILGRLITREALLERIWIDQTSSAGKPCMRKRRIWLLLGFAFGLERLLTRPVQASISARFALNLPSVRICSHHARKPILVSNQSINYTMKRYLGLICVFLSATLLVIGCGKSGDKVDAAPLEKSFASADASLKAAADKAVEAIKNADYTAATTELQKLLGNAKLTDEQRKAIQNVLDQIQKAVAAMSQKAAGEAGKAIGDVQKGLGK
jgi:hypothetical protein